MQPLFISHFLLLHILTPNVPKIFSFTRAQAQPDFLEINWQEVYQLNQEVPQGCSCQATGVPVRSCTDFECDCICDLTAQVCDPNCCCDKECTSDQIRRFSALGRCLPAGPPPSITQQCYSTSQLQAINPSFPFSADDTAQQALQALLCVDYDNSEVTGKFFSNPGYPPPSIFADPLGQNDFSYESLWSTLMKQPSSWGVTQDGTYDTGDLIPAAGLEMTLGGLASRWGGFLSIPQPGADGVCNEQNYASFLQPDKGTPCLRPITDLTTDCASLSAELFTNQLYIGQIGNAVPLSTFNNFVQVKIQQVSYRNFWTGAEVKYPQYNCGAYFINSSEVAREKQMAQLKATPSPTRLPTTIPTFQPTHAPTAISTLQPKHVPTTLFTLQRTLVQKKTQTFRPTYESSKSGTPLSTPGWKKNQTLQPTFEASKSGTPLSTLRSTLQPTVRPTMRPTSPELTFNGCTRPKGIILEEVPACRNALLELSYTVLYSANNANEIIGVYADLVVTDVPLSAFVNQTLPLDGIKQVYSISFQAANTSFTPSQAAGNLVKRKRSGNPGYIDGLPILTGRKITHANGTEEAIFELDGGLKVMGSASLGSSSCDQLWGSDGFSEGVLFNQDLLSGCTLELTLNELESICTGTNPLVTSQKVLKYLQVNATHVGIFGNADPLDVSQWLALDVELSVPSQSWNSRTLTCSNIYTSVQYRFLTANMGSSANPQRKIIAAQVIFGMDDWTFRPQTNRITQVFSLSNIVTFIRLEGQKLTAYTPPIPGSTTQLLLPFDVFYPFQLASSSCKKSLFMLHWIFETCVFVLVFAS